MRYYLGAPLGHSGLWGGVGMGRYGRRRVVYVRQHSDYSGCAGVLGVLVLVGLAISFWPITLALLALTVATVILQRRHRETTMAQPVVSKPPLRDICWIKGCRRIAEWQVALSKRGTDASSRAMLCSPHLDSLSSQLPLKEQYQVRR